MTLHLLPIPGLDTAPPSARDYLAGAAELFGVAPEELIGPRRAQPLALRRQLAMAAAARNPLLSYPAIGQAFERDHTTVMHARRRVDARAREDGAIERLVHAIEDRARAVAGRRWRAAA